VFNEHEGSTDFKICALTYTATDRLDEPNGVDLLDFFKNRQMIDLNMILTILVSCLSLIETQRLQNMQPGEL